MFEFIVFILLIVAALFPFLIYYNYSPPSPNNVSNHMTNIVSSYHFREETHDISGVKIHCVVKDSTQATDAVLVFIHGTASSSVTFFDTMKALPHTIKCVAIDLPAFGISGHIDTELYSTNEKLCVGYADVIGRTLCQMEIVEQTILVAHSLGGFLSIYVANRFPIKKLILLNPAGILPTLGIWGYYWAIFFKSGLPTTLFQLPMVSPDLLNYLGRLWLTGDGDNSNDPITEFWLSFFSNQFNEGSRIVQRMITLHPFYSYWNTPAISVLMDVYKKVPTSICFGVDDTICPSHIGAFLRRLTQGEIMLHNIQNANHNPCTNTVCMVKFLVDTCNDAVAKPEKSWRKKECKNDNERKYCCRGYSYPVLKKTRKSIQSVYDYLLTNTTLH